MDVDMSNTSDRVAIQALYNRLGITPAISSTDVRCAHLDDCSRQCKEGGRGFHTGTWPTSVRTTAARRSMGTPPESSLLRWSAAADMTQLKNLPLLTHRGVTQRVSHDIYDFTLLFKVW